MEDIIPPQFSDIELRPDDIYMYNAGNPIGVGLDPLMNDSIKVSVNVTYSEAQHGIIQFIEKMKDSFILLSLIFLVFVVPGGGGNKMFYHPGHLGSYFFLKIILVCQILIFL